MNSYILAIVCAAGLDVAANLLLADSEGFARRKQGIGALVLVGLAFLCLTWAVRGLDLSVAYAMWGGFGVLGTTLGGWFFFQQKPNVFAWVGIVLLMSGMAILHSS